MQDHNADNFPGDDHERIIRDAAILDRKREQIYDDVSSIQVAVDQILDDGQALRREQERLAAESAQHFKRVEGQRTLSNILLALILVTLLYRLF